MFWCTLPFFYLSLLHFFYFLFLSTCCVCFLTWQQFPNKRQFLTFAYPKIQLILCNSKLFSPSILGQWLALPPPKRGHIISLSVVNISNEEGNLDANRRNRAIIFILEQFLIQRGICKGFWQNLMVVRKRNILHMKVRRKIHFQSWSNVWKKLQRS